MLSAGLAVESAHHGLGGGLAGGLSGGLAGGLGGSLGGLGPPPHPMLQAFAGGEFLRPLPVPHRPGEPGPGAAMFSPPDLRYWLHHQQQQHLARFGGQTVSHHRMPASPTPQAPPPAPSPAPVNLSAPHKDDKDHLPPPPGPPMSFHYPHYPMFPAPYSPYAARGPPPPSDAPAAYSPPAGSPAPLPPPPPKPAAKTFKVPSGKEGSLKHRILTHPPAPAKQHHLHPHHHHQHPPSSRLTATVTALPTPVTSPATSDGHLHPASHPAQPHQLGQSALPHFWKGSLIRLASGEIRRIEDLKAEDFVASADRDPTLKADAATVVRIHTVCGSHRVLIGLRLGSQESEMETTSEHPFFVNGQGWASSSPERAMQLLGLSCKRLQVGDVCMSLTHRQPTPAPAAPTPAPAPAPTPVQAPPRPQPRKQNKRPAPQASSASNATSEPPGSNKKRRWSAPDELAAAEEAAMGPRLARVAE